MDMWPIPSADKYLAVGNDKDSSSIKKTLADASPGSWLKATGTEKELLIPMVNAIVLATWPSSV